MPQEIKQKSIYDRMDKIEYDLYFSQEKDNPSMTTRLRLMEELAERITDNLKYITKLVVGTIFTVIAGVVVILITRGH